MKPVIGAEAGQWQRASTEWERIVAKAATRGMRATLKDAVAAGREEIASAGFGSAFQRTLVGKMLSGSKEVLNPMAWVHSLANFADVFEEGKTITGERLLWLPLPPVPLYPVASGQPPRQLTPRKFMQVTGQRLILIHPRGKAPMLVLKGDQAGAIAAGSSKFQLRRGRGRQARQQPRIIPMFVGVSSANIPKKFNVHAAIENAVNENLQQHYLENLEKYEGR